MRCRYLVAAACLASGTAGLAATPMTGGWTETAINSAETTAVKAGSSGPAALRVQVLLDRAGFSMGVIDGNFGGLSDKAVRAFQMSRELPVTGAVDAATWAELLKDARPATVTLAISGEDAAGPFIAVPHEMADKAKLPALYYSTLVEAMAEKFHTTPAFIARLNPGVTQLAPGTMLLVPNIRGVAASADPAEPPPAAAVTAAARGWPETLNELSVAAEQPKAAKVVVDKSDRTVMAFDAAGKLLAAFPATIGSAHDPLPLGTWKIQGVSKTPTFHYNPALFWDADAKDVKAKVPAGPNNPVGVVWIDLSKPHYGIHGTPEPQTIGRTESHGCIRLTNWDAARLAQMVSPGVVAELQE